MLRKPPTFFCVEKSSLSANVSLSSGLDSESALAMTKLLRQLADHGHTIVATVHQPSAAIFFTFDRLCLLARGRYVLKNGM